ncbi:MAG: hypothetical protein AB8B93_05900 [Pseudomonadales bacterium]
MKIQDITTEVAMQSVRGGYNSISQASYNGPATGMASVHGSKFNLSPVSVTSDVLQQNQTSQLAAIDQLHSNDLSVSFDASQFSVGGFGRWFD